MSLPILAAPFAQPFRVGAWLAQRDAPALFVDVIVPLLWQEAIRHDVDPVGVVCQSAKETNFGRFTGAVPEWFKNTCGLKVLQPDEAPNLTWQHATFGSWRAGARAHVQHLLAYVAKSPKEMIVDPRYALVSGPVKYWSQLGGRWAPSPTYGEEIEAMMREVTA